MWGIWIGRIVDRGLWSVVPSPNRGVSYQWAVTTDVLGSIAYSRRTDVVKRDVERGELGSYGFTSICAHRFVS